SIDYAARHGIPVKVRKDNPFSIDENLWGRAIECGVLEDPWAAPPVEIYTLTDNPDGVTLDPWELVVQFDQGVPVALDLESITLERDLMREKSRLEPRYAELVYDGLWFSPLREALDAFMARSQAHVTGDVRLLLERGRCSVSGRRAEHGLYRYDLATYDASDAFRHQDSEGFVRLWGLSVETWAREQGGPGV